jgi:sugar lactone lactonase YvrE
LDYTPDTLGEAPWWDVATQTLIWVDIPAGRIRRARLDGDILADITLDTDVGFAIPMQDGLLAGVRSGLALVDEVTGKQAPLWTGVPAGSVRLNDGQTDRRGRLWFGTADESFTDRRGALYRVGADGPEVVLGDVTVANGMGFAPDDSVFYFADSTRHVIWAFDYDLATGAVSRQRLFAGDPVTRSPDGLTVDAEGCVWSAKWDGGCVVRYTPDGRTDRVIDLPVRRPTSVAFAGPDLRTLVITSAGLDPADGELAGAVFALDPGVQGIVEHPVNLMLTSWF